MRPHKTETTLRRGNACLACRKRKLKCDGIRPVCRQCAKMNRADACAYDDKEQKSRTTLLKEQLSQLERRLHDLESGSSSSSGAPSPYHTELDFEPTPCYDGTASNLQFPLYSFDSTSSPSPPHSETGSLSPSMLFNATGELQLRPENRPLSSPSTSLLGTPSYADPRKTLSSCAKQHLLDIFMAHRHQCWFYASIDRFLEPAQPGNEPHPALINAMYLFACHFANSQVYSDIEPAFFIQVQQEINAALDTSDRLPDIVQASALLAIYLYINNRVMEGYRHTFSAIKLAVAIGLHQIQPQSVLTGVYPAHALIPVPMPRDILELQDRVLAFWQIFMIDRCWSVANGFPLALPDKDTPQCRILTPWPSSLVPGKWDTIGFQQPLHAFFDGSETSDPSEETVPSLKAKAAALYELTARTTNGARNWQLALSVDSVQLTEHIQGSGPNDWKYRFSEAAVQRFSSTIPSVPVDRDYFVIQTMVYTSLIHLQRHATFDGRAFKAGQAIVQLICQLTDADWPYLDPIVSACWLSVAEMFIIAIANSKLGSGDLGDAISGYQRNLDVLNQALRSFGTYSSLSSEFALKIELARS